MTHKICVHGEYIGQCEICIRDDTIAKLMREIEQLKVTPPDAIPAYATKWEWDNMKAGAGEVFGVSTDKDGDDDIPIWIVPRVCMHCNGTGEDWEEDGKPYPCKHCDGTGNGVIRL